ncbi:DMT family transporter [Alkaliphilus transvaalensis]|uniref:DMT family transporter n=1 Tax=Alkaliphilus transvaalensis TaxID=114628 RepID=UPI00047881E2|nr:DMT family transporter [Alkaliphilus transvaalensis]
MISIFSVLVGGLISLMIMFNGSLANSLNNYTSNVIIHSVGLVALIFILIFNREQIKFKKNIPVYFYSGGAIGVFTVLFTNISFASLGITIPLALGLLGQSLASILIDHLGLMGGKVVKFQRKKCIGLLFILVGIVVMIAF